MCEKAEEIQEQWEPKSGDWIWRRYTVFGEELDKQFWDEEQRSEITILIQQSSYCGYWSATNERGEERIFNKGEDITRCTSLWLPRQDQLQEIWRQGEDSEVPFAELKLLYDEIHIISGKQTAEYLHSFKSMEQLWLAFVMKELYNKVWNAGYENNRGRWSKQD